MRWASLPTPTARKARASTFIFPPDPINADPTLPPHAHLAADAQQQEGFGHPLRPRRNSTPSNARTRTTRPTSAGTRSSGTCRLLRPKESRGRASSCESGGGSGSGGGGGSGGGSGGGDGSGPGVPPQSAFIEQMKDNLRACRKHENGAVKRKGAFPYNGGWANPPLPSLYTGLGAPPLEPFYLKKVLVWVPEYIWEDVHIPCPHCGARAQPDGDGWNTEPRRVFLEDDVCYMIGFRYECKECTRANKEDRSEDERTTQTFNAWDPAVLARMDDFVSEQFPFVLTKKAAINRTNHTVSKSLAQAYNSRYFSQMRSYVSLAKKGISKYRGLYGQQSNPDVPKFAGTGDPSGYNSSSPSAHHLADIWNKWFYETPVVQLVMLPSKYAKVIRLATGEDGTRALPVYGIFTIMNEYDQVVFSKAMSTASVYDLKNDPKMLFVKCVVGHGFTLPVIFYSDGCCEDRQLLLWMFKEIESENHVRLYDAAAEGAIELLPELTFPPGKRGELVYDLRPGVNVCLSVISVTPCRGRCRCSTPAWMRTRPFSFIRRSENSRILFSPLLRRICHPEPRYDSTPTIMPAVLVLEEWWTMMPLRKPWPLGALGGKAWTASRSQRQRGVQACSVRGTHGCTSCTPCVFRCGRWTCYVSEGRSCDDGGRAERRRCPTCSLGYRPRSSRERVETTSCGSSVFSEREHECSLQRRQLVLLLPDPSARGATNRKTRTTELRMAATAMTAATQGGCQPALNVRLDIFHALQRISRLCKTKHGAFKPFMARLRDACFIATRMTSRRHVLLTSLSLASYLLST
ncbi:unnamed protein product [Ectocarpus sp. CCAP 1310/34]|nr:unnamed protein product [Ectocarpus sp. CCAP 1310/34]